MRLIAASVTASVLMISATACGGGGETATNDEGVRKVTVGMLPILPTGAMQVGIDQGFFEDHDIDLTIETAQGGAALIPAVMSGKPQFASSNPISLLTARDKGLPVQVVSHWSSDHEAGEKGVNGVVALKKSGIAAPADLEGKTVAINTFKSMGDLAIREAVRKDGGDPDAVKFVELPFPDMPAALEGGDVDAAWMPEPFVGGLVKDGANLVTYATQAAVSGFPTQYIFTSEKLAKSEPKLVKDMTAALDETLEYADEHPDEVKAAAAKLIDIPPEALAGAEVESFGTDLRKDQLTRVGELMREDDLISKDADVSGLLP